MTRKGDWATAKVDALFKRNGGLLSGDDLVRSLRQERRRAVKACQREKVDIKEIRTLDDFAYNRACEDCARAIGGGK